jgi:NAD+ synthase
MLSNPEETAGLIVEWIRDFFDTNGHGCSAVVGISGGKDSSTVAALCQRALGTDRVVGVLMPSGTQPDIDDARLLVRTLGVPSVEVNIGGAVSALSSALTASGELENICGSAGLSADSTTNMPARIRMATLYAIAQTLPSGGRVANTCNLSEDYVGYSTKYGDAAGDFSPLAHLLVEEVRQIARVLGVPESLVEKAPADGLSGLSDEDKLGFTYDTLATYIQGGEVGDPATRARIERLHLANLHKLRPIPAFELPVSQRAPLSR